LAASLFYDGGNVYSNIIFQPDHEQYQILSVLGFRYRTPVARCDIDIGHNLNAPPGVKSTQYFRDAGQDV